MERKEDVEILMKKAKVGYQEAKEALEKCNWDMLDAIIYLERSGKVENNDTTTIIEVSEIREEKSDNRENEKEKEYGGIGQVVGRIFKFMGKIISKGNKNFFEVKKENEKPVRIPLTVAILLLLFLFPPTMILLVVGLFCGYKYSLSGPNINCKCVNDAFEKVSESADTIKNDFQKGYNEK